jgi:hypothetical protein
MNFKTFLLEGRGINNELKDYIKQIKRKLFSEFSNIENDILNDDYVEYELKIDNKILYVNYLEKVFNYKLDYTNKDLKIDEITFKCDIYIGDNLKDIDVKKNKFSIQETNLNQIENDFTISPVIYLTIFLEEKLFNSNEWANNGFMSSILHELQHVFQYWLMISKDEDYPLSMIKANNISRWYNSNENKNVKIYDLYYRLYLSRPHEITARTTQVYEILHNCNNFSLESLIDTVKISNEWKLSFYIESFSRKNFLSDLYTKYSKQEVLNILGELFSVINEKEFIIELNIKYTVLDESVINRWLKKCEGYFKSLGPKIRESLLRIAKETYADNNKLMLEDCNFKSFKILQ